MLKQQKMLFTPIALTASGKKKKQTLQTPVGELQHLGTDTDTQSKALFGFQPDTPHKGGTNTSELAGSC